MSLSPPAPRKPNHTRTITYDSFEREDGLYDLEGRVRDEKHYPFPERERGALPAGEAQHDIVARITFDDDLVVRGIEVELTTAPFAFCQGSTAAIPLLVGSSLLRGWRRKVSETLGGTAGCTHTRELLSSMPTVAIQTLTANEDRRMADAGLTDADRTQRPFFLNSCHSWAIDGPIVERQFPQFFGPAKETKDE